MACLQLKFYSNRDDCGHFMCRCYCILHDEDILSAMASLWKELKTAKSWEEIELTVWGGLNSYKGLT